MTIVTELCYKCVRCLLDRHLLLYLAEQLLLGFQARDVGFKIRCFWQMQKSFSEVI